MGAVTSSSPARQNSALGTIAVEVFYENRRDGSSWPETGHLNGSVVAEAVAHHVGFVEVKVAIADSSPLLPEVEFHSTFGAGCAVCKSYGYLLCIFNLLKRTKGRK